MSEPENFLERWSRRKREAEVAPEADAQANPVVAVGTGQVPAPAAPAAEEPAFDLSTLPSLEQIVADTDISAFMKPGVPAALRHAALRRAWTNDPAIRDFRGLQENDWDFTAPDGVPGFGTFKSEEEIKALAKRLFGSENDEVEPVPQSTPQDTGEAPVAETTTGGHETLDISQAAVSVADERTPEGDDETAAQQASDIATQRVTARRHGGALPQ